MRIAVAAARAAKARATVDAAERSRGVKLRLALKLVVESNARLN